MSPLEISQNKSEKRPIWKWRSVRIITALVLVYLALVFLVIPLTSKIYLQKWLLENGADTASIEKVVLRPIMGVVALHGVNIERDNKTVFSNATIHFDLDLRYLIDREAYIKKANLADIVLDIERYTDGSLRIGSYRIDPPAPPSPEEIPEVIEEIEGDLPWILFAREVSLTNVTLRYRQPGMQVEVVIEEANLEKFNTDPGNKDGALFLKATVNGSPVTLELPTLSISPTVELNGSVAISDFVLDELEDVLSPYLKPFKGTAGIQGEIDFAMTYDFANLNVHYKGLIDLVNGNIAGDGWATKSAVNWDGAVTFSMMNEDISIDVDGDLRTLNSSFDLADPVIDVDNGDISISGKTTVTIGKEVVIDTGASLKLASTHFAMDFLGADTGDMTWDGLVKVATGTETSPLTVNVDGALHIIDPAYTMGMGDGSLETATSLLDWNGQVDISVGAGEEPIVLEVDGELAAADASFALPSPVLGIDNKDLQVTGKTTITIGDEVVIGTDAALALGRTTFGMDNLETSVESFTWKGDVRVDTGSDTSPFKVFADGNLQSGGPAYSMNMDETVMKTGGELVGWNGLFEYTMEPGTNGSSVIHTNGKLAVESAQFEIPGTVDLSQGSLEAEGTSETTISGGIGVAYDGDIKLGDTNLKLSDLSAGEERFHWSGKAEYGVEGQRQELSLNGRLGIEKLFADIGGPALYFSQDRLDLVPEFSVALEDSATFTGELSLEAGGLEIQQKGSLLLNLKDISMSEARENGSGGISIESLAFNDLEMPSSETIPVTLNIPGITLSGIESPALASLSVDRLTIENPRVSNADGSLDLARLDTFAAESIEADRDLSVSIRQISSGASEFLVSEGKAPEVSLGGLSISDTSYSPETGLVTDTIEFDSIQGQFILKKTDSPAEDIAQEEDPAPEKRGDTGGLPIKISQVNVTGASSFKFIDESLTRTFATLLSVESLQVKNIDLNKVEQPFTYSLRGAIDKYSPLSIDGSCAPLAEYLMLEQSTTIKNVSMPHLSPYAIEAIGTWFPEGRLDLSSALLISEGNLDMDNTLLFKDLQSETVDGELAEKLNNQLPVSLDTALSLLRDRDGTIDIDVPISGQLSSLSIGIGDILMTALSKSITVAVTPYLAYTVLGPTGALAYVGVKLGQSLLETNLPILEYESGVVELSESQKAVLDKTGPVFEKNKEQTYSICAKVAPEELSKSSGANDAKKHQTAAGNEEIRRELFKLGENRSLAVKDYLVEKFDIAADRLLICNPGLIFEKGESSRIEFKK